MLRNDNMNIYNNNVCKIAYKIKMFQVNNNNNILVNKTKVLHHNKGYFLIHIKDN